MESGIPVRRPTADRLEVAAPTLAALLAAGLQRLPEAIRRPMLEAAFARARDAFNRGDMEVVLALFADDVEYQPPPPLAGGRRVIYGRGAVLDFWREQLARYEHSSIENVSVEELAPARFVRHARLRHRERGSGRELDYMILQTTDLRGGRVVRQVNALARG